MIFHMRINTALRALILFLLFPVYLFAQSSGNALPLKSTYPVSAGDDVVLKAAHVIPTANQYEALKDGYIAFIHFGPNTFTRLEWGSGMEDPKTFDLRNLDTDQWCRSMKDAGMKMVIITAKHHDGFVLWKSRYTEHGVMSSSFQGDIMKELSASCQKYGLKLGVYLSPADLFQIESPTGLYGNLSKYTERSIPRDVPGRPFKNQTKFKFLVDDYNEYFLNQLFELLTEYGPIHEVWFDGAHPKTKGGQKYNYIAWKELINKLAPKAVVFGKEDIRWCGNEDGGTRESEWNVIPYSFNPDTANYFPDLMGKTLGERADLPKGKYLHYQPAETNTSIREGWFYRDDTNQKVRSADDVFDMYERAVGGNSIFLLNIPPNREGKFSDRDVAALAESGKRIRDTYNTNLFKGAKGNAKVLDADAKSFVLLGQNGGSLEFTTPKAVRINRLVLQEAITSHGERVEEHALDAWLGGKWVEVATATNIGYKRILRFPEVVSSKFRVRVTKARYFPAISTVSAHYYKPKPPVLEVKADKEGLVSIAPKQHVFNWNPHGENASANINSGVTIRYTTDGSVPNAESKVYEGPFPAEKGVIKAAAFVSGLVGSVTSEPVAISKKDFNVVEASSEKGRYKAANAIDANSSSFWMSDTTQNNPFITLDLGKQYRLKGFAYTPQTYHSKGMLDKGNLLGSKDGKDWVAITNIQLGNLINDPSKRTVFFENQDAFRYIKVRGTGNSLSIAELDFYEE